MQREELYIIIKIIVQIYLVDSLLIGDMILLKENDIIPAYVLC